MSSAPRPVAALGWGPDVPVEDVPAHRRGESEARWNKAGLLQLNYLIAAGIRPEQRVLDIGCGALRAGAKIVAHQAPGRYYGIDADRKQLDAGYEHELARFGLTKRCPRQNLAHSAKFQHPLLTEGLVDVGICISVMPSLTLSHVQICLERVAPFFKPGAQLYISFLELPAGRRMCEPYTNMARFVSHGVTPPLHFYRRDMLQAALTSPWRARFLGHWGHPDGEVMMSYEKI